MHQEKKQKMKKLFLLTICLSTFNLLFAQSAKNEIAGVWSLNGIRNEPFGNFNTLKGSTTLKIFDECDNFKIIAVRNEGAIVTTTGTYKILSDSTYSENVSQRYNNANQGKDIVLKYELENKVLYTSFHLFEDGEGKPFKHFQQEMWRKVESTRQN